MHAGIALFELYLGLVKERRSHPRDDIITVLMETEVIDDDGLAERECQTLMRRQGDAVVALLVSRQLVRPSA
jgi:cytochrome P450